MDENETILEAFYLILLVPGHHSLSLLARISDFGHVQDMLERLRDFDSILL